MGVTQQWADIVGSVPDGLSQWEFKYRYHPEKENGIEHFLPEFKDTVSEPSFFWFDVKCIPYFLYCYTAMRKMSPYCEICLPEKHLGLKVHTEIIEEQNRTRGRDTGSKLTAVRGEGAWRGLDERRGRIKEHICVTHGHGQQCGGGLREAGQGLGGGGQRGWRWEHL